MAPRGNVLEVDGLDNVDRSQLKPWLVPLDEPKDDDFGADRHGDMGITTALVVVSLAAIAALAPIIGRKKVRTTVKVSDEQVDADGARRTVVTEHTFDAEWSEAEVVKALGEATNVDVRSLLDV